MGWFSRRKALDEPSVYRIGFLNGVLAFPTLIALIAYVTSIWVAFYNIEIEPPRTLGPPVYVPGPNGGVFLLTNQYETRVTGGGSRWSAFRGFEKVMHVDLWRLDADAARPVLRKRLLTEYHGDILDLGLMGADGDRLWIFLREPLVLSATTGEVLADAAAIEAKNEALRGVLPRQMRHYAFFNQHGFVFTAADARAWSVDPRTLAAVPWKPREAQPRPTAIAPAYFAAQSSTSFQKRGLLLSTRWLGVLTDDEAAALQPKPVVPGERRGAYQQFMDSMHGPTDLSHSGPKRYRMWHSKVEQVSAAPAGWPKALPDKWGLRPRYSTFAVFEKSPEFLQAGLLSDGRSKLPIWTTKPDSVLVLHRDRIDEDGRLHVTRFAGPDGHVLWDAALPLSLMQSVMPDQKTVLLFGRSYQPDRPRVGDPYHTAHEWVIALELATGTVRAFDLSAVDADK